MKCIGCKAKIPAERLRILPNTQFCVTCSREPRIQAEVLEIRELEDASTPFIDPDVPVYKGRIPSEEGDSRG